MTEPQPFACTLTFEEVPARVEQIQRLIRGLRARERDRREVRLRFDAALAPVVRAFVVDESRCCGFFDFALSEHADAVDLRVRAPAGAEQLLASLYAAFHPTRPEGGSDDR